jgi:ATP-binding cassette subfamily B protein
MKKSKPHKASVNYKTLFRLYRVFGRYYKKHWKMALLAYSGLLLTIAVALLQPWPLKLIIDNVILRRPLPPKAAFITQWFGSEAQGLLLGLVLVFVALRVLDSIFSYMHKIGILTIGEKIIADIRQDIFAHLQRLSLSFHSSARSGDLIYRLTTDIHEIKTILIQVPMFFTYRLFIVVSHVGLMLFLEWRLALVAFAVIPILYYYQRRMGGDVQSATREKRKKEGEVSSLVSENITAMALVHAYGREDLHEARFIAENRLSLESGITALQVSKLFKRLSDILMAVGTAGVVGYGAMLALDGAILPGTLVLFVSYLKNLYKPIEMFAEMYLDVAKSQVSGERLLELVDSEMVMADHPRAVAAPPFKGKIEFRNVSFAYHKGIDVIKHLTFTVEPGETVALLGHSGAGKSTLISLLLRFYDPQDGQILIDGFDLRTVTLKSLRAQMTVLLQEAKLFNLSVRENIAFGKAEATFEEIVEAAKLAQAHEFIVEMPEGYDTVIYEGGDNLSGGQEQRINIARAIIRNTPILILDEPATALDARTEAKVQQALRALTRGKTTFIIAHKFSTVAHADKILLLEQGKLAAYGTHDELMRTSYEYQELYKLQFDPLLIDSERVGEQEKRGLQEIQHSL